MPDGLSGNPWKYSKGVVHGLLLLTGFMGFLFGAVAGFYFYQLLLSIEWIEQDYFRQWVFKTLSITIAAFVVAMACRKLCVFCCTKKQS
ncbi:MAG: hypothetical protein ACF8OB_14450 [Phycisphaeraceae bacterium JB051]